MSAATITLPISGMSCAACSSYIEQTLQAMPGVTRASVSLLANQATITTELPPETLIAAIKDAGYDASLPLEGAQTAPEESEASLPLRTAAALTIACLSMLLSMGLTHGDRMSALMPSAFMHLPAAPVRYLLLALSLTVMLFLSPETYHRAWSAARHRSTNMSTLIALGTLAALAWSATATVAPTLFTNRNLVPDVYYEAIDFILAFLLLGAWLDSRAKRRTQSALSAFSQLTSSTARVLRNHIEVELPISDLNPGELVLLRPGERIPIDGIVRAGTSTVDESLLTGESAPVVKQPQSPVVGGTINLDGPLTIEATTLGSASVLFQLRRLLAEAQSSRAPMQKLADRASAVFVPAVIGFAALTFAAWITIPALLHRPAELPRAFAATIAVLVIACPCAMGLAVPAALTVAIGRAAQLGILIKNGEALERLARTRNLALDKTGTLTEGRPRIVSVEFNSGVPVANQHHLLQLAASLEHHSEHPLARAVKSYVNRSELLSLTDVKVIPGQGITAVHNNQTVTIGNERLTGGVKAPSPLMSVSASGRPATQLHLSVDGIHRLILHAIDTVRPSAPAALAQLTALGVTPHILTGDNDVTATQIAETLGIPSTQTYSQLLPADKLRVIRALQQKAPTAMVGDGLNDAAALAQADTGIAMSGSENGHTTGTDLTREAADLVLLRPDLTLIPTALRLTQCATRTMRQNLCWAVAYNLLGLPVAAGILYPHFHILLSPALASAAMALSSTSVLFNSLRLRRSH